MKLVEERRVERAERDGGFEGVRAGSSGKGSGELAARGRFAAHNADSGVGEDLQNPLDCRPLQLSGSVEPIAGLRCYNRRAFPAHLENFPMMLRSSPPRRLAASLPRS